MFSQVADQRFSNLLSSNKEVIIMGGRNNNGVCKSVTIFNDFNPAKGTYAQLPPMNSPRQGASSCVYNNDVIIAGGHDGRADLDTIEILKFNHGTPRWTTLRSKLPFRVTGPVVKVYQEKLLVIGGLNCDTDHISDEIHELVLSKPSTAALLATIPQPRIGHTAEIVNDKLHILGGVRKRAGTDKATDHILDSVLMYDFITKQFTTCPPLPKPVSSMSTVTWGNKIIITGGRDSNHHCINDVIMYDTETGRSERLPSMNNNRSEHVAVTCDDVIVVLGGRNEEGDLNSVESWKIDSDENWKKLPPMPEKIDFLAAVVKP
jgi:N-acetylneuraminic acid mutarotase